MNEPLIGQCHICGDNLTADHLKECHKQRDVNSYHECDTRIDPCDNPPENVEDKPLSTDELDAIEEEWTDLPGYHTIEVHHFYPHIQALIAALRASQAEAAMYKRAAKKLADKLEKRTIVPLNTTKEELLKWAMEKTDNTQGSDAG